MRFLSFSLLVPLLRTLLLVCLAASALAQDKAVVTTPQVRAELLAHAPQGIGGNAPVWVGLQLTHQPHWHTYWKNSGDSGLPTSLEWTLPPGVMAGDIAWPLPKKITIGPLVNFGYEGTLLLPVPLTITPEFKPGFGQDSLPVKLKASWLVCRQECIPEEGEFTLNLPLRSSTALSGAAFDAALAAQPQALKAGKDSRIQVEGGQLQIQIGGLPAAWRGKTLEVFPETPEIIDNGGESGKRWVQGWNGALWTATLPISPLRSASPAQLPLVLIQGGRGVRVVLPISGHWPDATAKTGVSPALAAALAANAANTTGTGTATQAATPAAAASATASGPVSAAPAPQAPGMTAPGSPSTAAAPGLVGWLSALLGAFLGGLILNLMPCVFPVLAVKVLGFAQHADDTRAHRLSGLAYTAGVLASFLALGALLLALRAAGEGLGWGFQLQNPWVVAALAALFTGLGLNLAGLFEFGHFLPSSVASLQARHPVLDAFLTGVLAVAVASPCTAPFMGAALGLAVGLPAVQALAVFAAIGLGLALPYLLASWIPAVAYALPRPGAWMATFRHLLAFPMFATVVWLVWVLGQQSGIDGVAALLALLVSGAFLVWTLTLAGRTRWLLGTIALVLTAFLARHLGPELARPPAAAPSASADSHGWQPWSAEREASLRAGNRPVFVDFTAAWCVTCQVNKKTTLSDPAVLADLSAKQVQLLRADWTRRDPAITAALSQLGRSGVPVYVLYAPGQAPVVLSEVLSVDEVRAALARL